MQNNPLLNLAPEIRFDLIKAEHIVPAVRTALAEELTRQSKIGSLKSSERTTENTLLAFDRLGMRLAEVWSVVTELKLLIGSEEIQKAVDEVEPEVEGFMSKIFLSQELCQALKEFSTSDNIARLSLGQKRALDKLMKTFELNGVNLPKKERDRLSKIDTELAAKATQFDNNLKIANKAFEILVDTPPLGIPADFIARAKESAEKNGKEGKYRFGADAGSFEAIIKFATDRELRKRMHREFHSRCLTGELDNIAVAEEELRLRQEKARILKDAGVAGVQSYADYSVALRVAKNSDNIMHFLGDLESAARPAFEQERQELTEFTQKFEKDPNFKIEAWDVPFYSERLREQQCGFKEEEIKPYLERDQFISSSFKLAEQLYTIRFEPNTTLPTWHEDVQKFNIISSSGNKLGLFYVDLYSRSGEKREGAWQDTIIRRHPGITGREYWVGLLSCNFPRPAKGQASLLTPREAETFLHEFGHLLQQLAVESAEICLAEPPWDAIEIPSQLNENYFWEREWFMRSAVHFETGQQCPEDLFKRLQKSQHFQKGLHFMTQFGYSMLDMVAHTDDDITSNGGLRARGLEILNKCSVSDLPEYQIMYNRFSHIFSGEYAAGYYSYAWALAMACDCFCYIRKHGIFDVKTAKRYWDLVLATGDKRDALGAVNEFLERPESAPIRAGSIAEFYGLGVCCVDITTPKCLLASRRSN